MKNLIILCAGKSSRTKTTTSKILLNILNLPIIKHITNQLLPIGFDNVVLVVGKEYNHIKSVVGWGNLPSTTRGIGHSKCGV